MLIWNLKARRLLLNDIIPKSNDGHYKQLQDSINVFQNSVAEDTKKLLNSVNKENSLSLFLSTFENKSNNLGLRLVTKGKDSYRFSGNGKKNNNIF